MDPRDSPEEAAFRAEARRFLAAHAEPYASAPIAPSAIVAEWGPQEEVERLRAAKAWQRRKFDSGWAGIAWPAGYGGRGGTLVEAIIFAQEEAAFDVPRDALAVGLGWCGPAVLLHGDEEQRRRFLRPLLAGDEMWCQLFSEPGAGSDLAGLQTRAEPDGGEWVLSGQKVWTTFAHRSQWGLCIARHDPHVVRHDGLTAFIVDMSAPGVEARPVRQMTGSSNFNEVFLAGVRVPDAHRVGAVGEGWALVRTTFMFERAAASFGGSVPLKAMGRLTAQQGRTDRRWRDALARLHVDYRVVALTYLRSLTALAHGRAPGPEGSLIKLAGTTLLSAVYDLAVDVLGAGGLLADADAWAEGEWHDAFVGSPGLRIGGGTDEIQRNIIAERILGLPRDPLP